MSAKPTTLSAKEYFAMYLLADETKRIEIIEEAQEHLSGNQMKLFKKEVKKHEDEQLGDSEIGTTAKTPDGSSIVPPEDKGKGVVKPTVEISNAEMLKFWNELEGMSGDELVSEQVIEDFRYVGFDPNVILKSIIQKGRAAKRTNDQIKSDIASMCTIAVIKGSITETNLKKMSDPGKKAYSVLEARYGLKKGGSKGVDPSVVTVARVGAAFPGSIMKILIKKPELAKKFSGSFGSKILPPYLRHQSAAACIPETLDEKVKTYLLGLITAYTSDQSRVISKNKGKNETTALELYETQENFIMQTHGSNYPTAKVRTEIFGTWSLIADYGKLKAVGDNISKINKSFDQISEDDLKAALGAA